MSPVYRRVSQTSRWTVKSRDDVEKIRLEAAARLGQELYLNKHMKIEIVANFKEVTATASVFILDQGGTL